MSLTCPKCSDFDVHRSRLRWWDYVLALACRFPYRCHRCTHRFHLFGAKRHETNELTHS